MHGNQMLRLWYRMGMLAAESQQVMWLRAWKLAAGGPAASAEAERMVTEKVTAAASAAAELVRGGSPEKMIEGYRRKVRANRRRLSR